MSDFITSGIPLRVKVLSSLSMTSCVEVELTISTNGNLLYSSMTTKRDWFGEIWPKSILSSVQGALGNGDILSGSQLNVGVAI